MNESIKQLALRVAVARAICRSCGEAPDHLGDAGGNAHRWQDYLPCADAAIAELAKQQEPVRWEVKAPTGTTIFYDETSAENYASQWDAMGAYAGQGIATVKKVPAIPQPAAVSDVTDAMALAFHHALTDGSIGAGEVEEIKTGLRAALSAAPVPPTDERFKDLERQRDNLVDALERMRVSGGRAEFHAAYEEALCILDNVKGTGP